MSARVTINRFTHTAAISPFGAGPNDMDTFALPLTAGEFFEPRRKNTRTRFCAVSVVCALKEGSVFCIVPIAAVLSRSIRHKAPGSVPWRLLAAAFCIRMPAAPSAAVQQPPADLFDDRSFSETASRTAGADMLPCVTASTILSDLALRSRSERPVSTMVIACTGLMRCGSRTVPPSPDEARA